MFHKRKSKNPEVEKAIEERDNLMANVQGAVDKVDRLQEELLEEYAEIDDALERQKWK